MAHDQVGTDGLTHSQRLQQTDDDAQLNLVSFSDGLFNEVANQITSTEFAAYIPGIKNYNSFDGFLGDLISNGVISSSERETVRQVYIQTVREIWQIDPNDATKGDWSVYFTKRLEDDPTLNVEAEMETLIVNSLNHFFESKQGTNWASQSQFYASLDEFYGLLALLLNNTPTPPPQMIGNTVIDDVSELTTFEDIYQASGLKPADFGQTLVNYILDNEGFVPSQNFLDWKSELQYQEALKGLKTGPVFETAPENPIYSVSTGTARSLAIIDRILYLIITMIDVLNLVAKTQAERISKIDENGKDVGLLNNMQKKYTDAIQAVKVIGPILDNDGKDDVNNPKFINHITNAVSTTGAGEDAPTRRTSLNVMGSAWVESLKNKRSQITDDTKKIQSAIQASQDTANQQTTIGTALLRTLTSLVNAIFK